MAMFPFLKLSNLLCSVDNSDDVEDFVENDSSLHEEDDKDEVENEVMMQIEVELLSNVSPFGMINALKRGSKKNAMMYSKAEILAGLVAYNVKLANFEYCTCYTRNLSSLSKYKKLKCNCLSILLEDITNIMESVANYQFYFTNLVYSEEQNRFLEWVKYAALTPNVQGPRQKYLIPFSPGNQTMNLELDELFNNNQVCISALLIIFGKKYKFYHKVRQHFNNRTMPISQQ